MNDILPYYVTFTRSPWWPELLAFSHNIMTSGCQDIVTMSMISYHARSLLKFHPDGQSSWPMHQDFVLNNFIDLQMVAPPGVIININLCKSMRWCNTQQYKCFSDDVWVSQLSNNSPVISGLFKATKNIHIWKWWILCLRVWFIIRTTIWRNTSWWTTGYLQGKQQWLKVMLEKSNNTVIDVLLNCI